MKSDGPTKEIKSALEKAGASVAYILSRPGRGQSGLPDLLVAFNGKNFLMEVKSETGRLSEAQVLFHSNWQAPVYVVTSAKEALSVIL